MEAEEEIVAIYGPNFAPPEWFFPLAMKSVLSNENYPPLISALLLKLANRKYHK